MSLTVRIQPQAEQDILANMVWWAENHSADEALAWYAIITGQIQQIAVAPESHGVSAESSFFPYIIRDALIGKGRRGSYRAVFTVSENQVVVLRVLRSSQNTIKPRDVSFP